MMEWRKCYLDVILVPTAFFINIAYHFWLWHMVRTHPSRTIIGINASGRRNWVSSMMKVLSLYIIYSSSNNIIVLHIKKNNIALHLFIRISHLVVS